MGPSQALRSITGAIAEALFPRRCSGCQRSGAVLCRSCAAQLPRVPEPQCRACGMPLATPPCRHCAEFPLLLDELRSVYVHGAHLRSALLRFKYVGARAAARDLAPLLAEYVATRRWPVATVAGVPLHPNRLRQRGYNQAEALATELAERLGLPRLPAGALRRVRDTPPQARQPDRHARWRNVAQAFAAEPSLVAGRRVLLVDDVCTTGATLNACGAALKAAGAGAVYGLTLARAL